MDKLIFAEDLDGTRGLAADATLAYVKVDGTTLGFDQDGALRVQAAAQEPTGFQEASDTVLTFTDATRTLSLAPAAASFTVWVKGVAFTKSVADTVVVPDTTGLWYISYDNAGVLQALSTPFDFANVAPVAYVYWNATLAAATFLGEERHGVAMDWATHEYLHTSQGAAYLSGFGLTFTAGGNGSQDSHAQVGLSGGVIADEDLSIAITHSATPAALSFQQQLEGTARLPVLYREGTRWTLDAATAFPLKAGASRPMFNLNTSGLWSTQDVPNQQYLVTWVVATNNMKAPVVALMGQAAYTTRADADAAAYTSLDLAGLPLNEMRPLYKLVYQAGTAFANTIKATLANVVDARKTELTGFGTPALPTGAHGSLGGLAADDHPQYFNTVRGDARYVRVVYLNAATPATSTVFDSVRPAVTHDAALQRPLPH